MIQQARSINSQSLLREIEYSILLLENQEDVDYFQSRFEEVVDKRKDDDTRYTGVKSVRQELLACLRQYGEVKTANIWARNLLIDFDSIQNLRHEIAETLSDYGIYGIVEIHLQDREINSSHLQFTGTNAELAEYLIAEIVVKNRYELSIEKAISKNNFARAYETQTGLKTYELAHELEQQAKFHKAEEIKREWQEELNIDSWFESFKAKQNKINELLDKKLSEPIVRRERASFKDIEIKRKSKEQIFNEINSKSLDEAIRDASEAREKIRKRRK